MGFPATKLREAACNSAAGGAPTLPTTGMTATCASFTAKTNREDRSDADDMKEIPRYRLKVRSRSSPMERGAVKIAHQGLRGCAAERVAKTRHLPKF